MFSVCGPLGERHRQIYASARPSVTRNLRVIPPPRPNSRPLSATRSALGAPGPGRGATANNAIATAAARTEGRVMKDLLRGSAIDLSGLGAAPGRTPLRPRPGWPAPQYYQTGV